MISLGILLLPLLWFLVRMFVRFLDRWEAKRCSFGDQFACGLLMSSRENHKALKSAFVNFKLPDERYFYSLCASRFISRSVLKKWVELEPDSADARLCYGAQLLQSAWEARGYGRGFQVSQKSADKYHDFLEEARNNFEACIHLDNADATPWAYLLVVYTGIDNDCDLRDFYFENAIARDPQNWAAHMHMIIALSEKWGGCNQEMVKFAKEASSKAKKGSDLSLLFVKAYLELYKFKELFEEDETGAIAFKGSPSILDEINNAYDESEISNNSEISKTSIFTRYNVSGWFCLAGENSRMENELKGLEGRILDIHWRWVGSEGMLKNAKKRLGIAG